MKSLVQLYLFEIRYSLLDIRYSLFLFSFFVSHSSFAQEDTAIVRTYGGPYYEEGRQIIECAEGGYAIIGTTGSDQQNNTNFYLLRLDEELNCMWSKSLGGPEVEWGYSILEDAGGNFLLCGYTNSYGAGAYDVLVYKVDPLGEVIWQQTFGGTDWDFAYKLIAHPEEGYLICGKTYSMGNGGSDGYLLHIDTEGNLISEWTYGEDGDDEFVDVEILVQDKSEEKILVAGTSYDAQSVSQQGTISCLQLDGFLTWSYQTETDLSVVSDLEVTESRILFCGNWQATSDFLGPIMGVLDFLGSETFFEFNQYEGDFSFSSIDAIDDDFSVCGYTNAFGTGTNNGYFTRRSGDGGFITGISIGAVFLEFYDSIIVDDRLVLIGSAINVGFELPQLPVMIYPDLTFSASSTTNWSQDNCFTTQVEDNPPSTDIFKVKGYMIYDMSGRLIDEFSDGEMSEFLEEYSLIKNESRLLVNRKKNGAIFLCVPY